jgi:hypothetical protein
MVMDDALITALGKRHRLLSAELAVNRKIWAAEKESADHVLAMQMKLFIFIFLFMLFVKAGCSLYTLLGL